jgi:YEATS domain-containing protein 4
VGIPGELGSADVPLEYSLAMEKGEWNKLDDVRVKIVEQMDRWRWVR